MADADAVHVERVAVDDPYASRHVCQHTAAKKLQHNAKPSHFARYLDRGYLLRPIRRSIRLSKLGVVAIGAEAGARGAGRGGGLLGMR